MRPGSPPARIRDRGYWHYPDTIITRHIEKRGDQRAQKRRIVLFGRGVRKKPSGCGKSKIRKLRCTKMYKKIRHPVAKSIKNARQRITSEMKYKCIKAKGNVQDPCPKTVASLSSARQKRLPFTEKILAK